MKQIFQFSLIGLTLVVVFSTRAISAPNSAAEKKHNIAAAKVRGYSKELTAFIKQLSALDDDESSPINILSKQICNGNAVSKNAIVEALVHAESVIAEYSDEMSDAQIVAISDMFNELLDTVMQESDSDTRDGFSACDEDSALKIKKILCVLNKAIFCGLVVFRDEAVFCKHVEMKDSLSVRRLRAHKAKIDQLEAKKAEFDKLKAKKAKIKNLETEEIETCDLIVDCNIYMQNSTSPAIGNIYKDGDRFLHNFGTNNTYVGEDAGNFTSAGSDNTGLGYHALLNNNESELVAIGSGALENYIISSNPMDPAQSVAVGFNALHSNVSGSNNTAVGWSALASDVTDAASSSFGNNTAVGWSALTANTIGTQNTALGTRSLVSNTIGNQNTAVGFRSLASNTIGSQNTAVGNFSLNSNTIGSHNTALGFGTLNSNTIGDENTALGFGALNRNTTGEANTAVGDNALLLNTTGISNTALGFIAMQGTGTATGSNNTGVGKAALFSIDSGSQNTAVGRDALSSITSSNDNTAVGHRAMSNVITGANNIAIGADAGINLASAESNDIYIGNAGVLGESAAIRIGTIGTQTTNFQAGIFGAGPIVGAAVLIDAVTGQLGTVPSARKYKENIQDMNEESAAILGLRPVIFSYKADAQHTKQFGLVAEEVNAVMPALVVKGVDGQIETVKYHDLAVLLLNEVIKLKAEQTKTNARFAELEAQVKELIS